jgi:hypothetical protein
VTDLPTLIGLQEADGLEVGRALQSNRICTDTCHLTASDMRKDLVKYKPESDPKVDLTVDQSTTNETDALVSVHVADCHNKRTHVASCLTSLNWTRHEPRVLRKCVSVTCAAMSSR